MVCLSLRQKISAVSFVIFFLLPISVVAQSTPQSATGWPLQGLTTEQLESFRRGRDLFNKSFTESEGLGPVFNQSSCAFCHGGPGVIGLDGLPALGGQGVTSHHVTRAGQIQNGSFSDLAEWGGSLFQSRGVIGASGENCSDPLDPVFDIPLPGIVQDTRIATPTFGSGLVEAIRDEDILAKERPNPVNNGSVIHPMVTGRAHIVPQFDGPNTVGRFGWKAQLASILAFSADAAVNEMGITNEIFPDENDPSGIHGASLEECDLSDIPDPEDRPDAEGLTFVQRVTDFQRLLAPPPQTPLRGMLGEELFIQAGCADCHSATAYTTRGDDVVEDVFRNKSIKPYSDFLLHDMGPSGDSIAQGDAGLNEMRTPPLWGMRNRFSFLHYGDHPQNGEMPGTMLWNGPGLDLNTTEFREWFLEGLNNVVIAGHQGDPQVYGDSEGDAAAEAYLALTQEQRFEIYKFLASLGRRPFDMNDDNAIDLGDVGAFVACLSNPELNGQLTPVRAESYPCGIADYDSDGTIGLVDVGYFAQALTMDRDIRQ